MPTQERKTPWIVASAASLLSIFTSATIAEPVKIQLDPSRRHQTIEGFGASGAWTAQISDQWKPETRQRAIDLLFTDEGAALSIWRYNIGAGSGEEIHDATRRTKSVEIEPGSRKYDLSRDKAAIDFMMEGVKRSVKRVVCFAVSPPPHTTVNGKVWGGTNGSPNLRDDKLDAFADYLVDIVMKLRDDMKLPDVRLSPMNEPQWNWGHEGNQRQEGCHMPSEQMARLFRAVAIRLRERAPRILLEGPESGEWGGAAFEYVDALQKDPMVHTQLGAFAIHSYWSNDDKRRDFMKKYRDAGLSVPISQTESCVMAWGRFDDMDGAFRLFNDMQSDLTICNVVSWSWWLAISNYDYGDGLLYLDQDGGISPAKRLYVMGHFSRFVKPGAIRIETKAPEKPLRMSAYLSADKRSYVTVISNPSGDTVETQITAPHAAAKSTLYVTDTTRNASSEETPTNRITLPPKSIATVVTTLGR